MNDTQFVNPTAAAIDYPSAVPGTSEGDQIPLPSTGLTSSWCGHTGVPMGVWVVG